jgi:hypothetical protein
MHSLLTLITWSTSQIAQVKMKKIPPLRKWMNAPSENGVAQRSGKGMATTNIYIQRGV